MTKDYTELKAKLQGVSEQRFDSRVEHFIKEIRVLSLPKTLKATRWLLEEMNAENGFKRHDGRDYFIHPIAVAQMALDFKIVGDLIRQADTKSADILLATCLLHDIVEDVDYITSETIKEEFGIDVMRNVDNVSKREGEAFSDYIDRFSSDPISSLVKILDRLNNVSTLANSTAKHRKNQLEETRTIYIPLTKIFRRKYWEFGDFYYQAMSIMKSLLSEVDREVKTQIENERLIAENDELKKQLQRLTKNKK